MKLANRTTHLCLAVMLILLVASAFAADKSDRLNHESLKLMLENMGYEIHKSGKFNSGTPWLMLKLNEGGRDNFLLVSLTQDQKTVWVIADLVTLGKGQELPRDIAIKMLDHNNDDSVHVYFAYNVEDRHPRLKAALPNRSVTPSALRRLIRETVETLKSEQKIWDPKNWLKESKESKD